MTPNSSDTRAHIAHSVRFHLFHVIRHRRKQSRRRNSITEKEILTQRSNPLHITFSCSFPGIYNRESGI
jgi:hypothetical protein